MDRQYQELVREALQEQEINPFTCKNARSLHGQLEGLFRYRVGKFRMIFRIITETGEIRILAIASRGDIY